jgi:hypothetical protein
MGRRQGRKTMGWGAMLAFAILLPGAGVSQETHRLTGDQVAVYNLAGHVEVIAGTGSEPAPGD